MPRRGAFACWKPWTEASHPRPSSAMPARDGAGQALAMPGLPCRGDVFHALQFLHPLVTYLENRAFAAIEARDKLERQKARFQRRGERTNRVTRHLNSAIRAEAEAITLADNAAILADWMRRDILSLTGPDYATRCGLFDFVVAELKSANSSARTASARSSGP